MEFDITSLEYGEDYPEWFYLDFSFDGPRIIVAIHKKILDWFYENIQNNRIIQHISNEMGWEFLPDFTKPWGFGEILIPTGNSGDFIVFSIEIPQAEFDTGPCNECEGDGKNKDLPELMCFDCMGRGMDYRRDEKLLNQTSATLTALGPIFQHLDTSLLEKMSGEKKQLLEISLFFDTDQRNAPISGSLSKEFCDYLLLYSNRELSATKNAMISAVNKAFPTLGSLDFRYTAAIYDRGQLILEVPGDACGLGITGYSDFLRGGGSSASLDCHNVDCPYQQIGLLAGLAHLSGVVRKRLA